MSQIEKLLEEADAVFTWSESAPLTGKDVLRVRPIVAAAREEWGADQATIKRLGKENNNLFGQKAKDNATIAALKQRIEKLKDGVIHPAINFTRDCGVFECGCCGYEADTFPNFIHKPDCPMIDVTATDKASVEMNLPTPEQLEKNLKGLRELAEKSDNHIPGIVSGVNPCTCCEYCRPKKDGPIAEAVKPDSEEEK